MRKVMLVDDEVFITEGLVALIDWKKFNLEVVHKAVNGVDALKKFKEEPVDIIITDINMPQKTGLELLKEIKEIHPHVKFIILSGYDEFSYAKKAIDYGVETYILKPIDEEELELALQKIVNNLSQEKKFFSNDLDKTGRLLAFLNGQCELNELKEFQKDIYIKFDHAKYTVSNIFIQSQNDILDYKKIHQILKQVFKNDYEALYQFNNQIIVINSWKVTCTEEEILSYYDELKNQLLNQVESDFFISLGTIVEEIRYLKDSYSNAKKLKKFMLTKGANIVLTEKMISCVESRKINFKDEINQINKLVIEKNFEALKKYVETLYAQETLTPTNIYDLSIKIVLLIDSMREEFQVNKNYYESLSDIIIKLCNESTRESVKTFILSELETFMETMHQDVVKYSPVVQQVVNLVNEHYYEELSLKTLAYQYNINSSYLGQLFNKEVGTSFSDYLNKTKNLKAKQLILETNMKINDIAKEVGYTDSSYFYRKFKKFFGVSPSSLRELKVYGASSVDERVI